MPRKTIRIYKSGKDLVLRIPSHIVEKLKLRPGDEFVYEFDGRRIILTKLEIGDRHEEA